MIYFLQSRPDQPVKIGYTKNIKQRIADLQTGNPNRLYCLGILSDPSYTEQSVHIKFSHLRLSGEWFRPEKELLDFIKVKAQDTDEFFRKEIEIDLEMYNGRVVYSCLKPSFKVEYYYKFIDKSGVTFLKAMLSIVKYCINNFDSKKISVSCRVKNRNINFSNFCASVINNKVYKNWYLNNGKTNEGKTPFAVKEWTELAKLALDNKVNVRCSTKEF